MERMRKFLKFLSQRIVIVTFLIFLQIMWFVGMFLKVTSYSQYITAAFKILSILVVIYIMNRSDNPSVKLGWIVVILLFPLFGGLLYLTIGGKQPISYLRRKLEPMIEESARHLKADPEIEQEKRTAVRLRRFTIWSTSQDFPLTKTQRWIIIHQVKTALK